MFKHKKTIKGLTQSIPNMKLRTLGAILALSLASAPSFTQTCSPVCSAIGLTTAYEYIRELAMGSYMLILSQNKQTLNSTLFSKE